MSVPERYYTRVAVVQLDVQPALLLRRVSPLEDPLYKVGRPSSLVPENEQISDGWAERIKELEKRIRAAYVGQLRGKVLAVLEACRGWGVQLVVFPEYSIPGELLTDMASMSDDLIIVAGTHAVERRFRRDKLYGRLGWPREPPRTGEAVVPCCTVGA